MLGKWLSDVLMLVHCRLGAVWAKVLPAARLDAKRMKPCMCDTYINEPARWTQGAVSQREKNVAARPEMEDCSRQCMHQPTNLHTESYLSSRSNS